MKTLIVHPQDPTTIFLRGLYLDLPDKTVITGGITKTDLVTLINSHKKIICCGHGSPMGLLSVGQFPDAGLYIIDDSLVESLRHKPNTTYIWCYANEFVQRHGLTGLNSSMFISSVDESWMYGFWDVEWDTIRESNEGFSSILAQYMQEPLDVLYSYLMRDYGKLARTNPIAKFNHKRLYLTLPQKPVMLADMVRNMN